MRNYAELNRVGLYRQLRSEDLVINAYTGGYPYLQGGLLMRSSLTEPIYPYGKNFKKHGKLFSLFIWTTEKDPKKISDFFERAMKTVTKEHVSTVLNNVKSFVYLDTEYKEQ